MAGPALPSHDIALTYAPFPVGEVTGGFSTTSAADGSGVLLEGVCPRCAGPIATLFSYAAPGHGTKGLRSWLTGGRTRSGDTDPLHTEVHYCECGHAHPGIPADTAFTGCGASWSIVSGTP